MPAEPGADFKLGHYPPALLELPPALLELPPALFALPPVRFALPPALFALPPRRELAPDVLPEPPLAVWVAPAFDVRPPLAGSVRLPALLAVRSPPSDAPQLTSTLSAGTNNVERESHRIGIADSIAKDSRHTCPASSEED